MTSLLWNMCLCILEFSKIAALGHEYIYFSEANLFSVLSALIGYLDYAYCNFSNFIII